jgi:hypothetical protein
LQGQPCQDGACFKCSSALPLSKPATACVSRCDTGQSQGNHKIRCGCAAAQHHLQPLPG